jgi:hypothetical protein
MNEASFFRQLISYHVRFIPAISIDVFIFTGSMEFRISNARHKHLASFHAVSRSGTHKYLTNESPIPNNVSEWECLPISEVLIEKLPLKC